MGDEAPSVLRLWGNDWQASREPLTPEQIEATCIALRVRRAGYTRAGVQTIRRLAGDLLEGRAREARLLMVLREIRQRLAEGDTAGASALIASVLDPSPTGLRKAPR